jgi:uncharacterized protein
MSTRAAYVDASAFVKLVTEEPESPALEHHLARRELTSSALLRTEARRAVRHLGVDAVEMAVTSLSAVTLVAVSEEILDQAGMLDPQILRSLDAIHLSTALAVGEDLGSVVTYDARMRRGAQILDLRVESPA